MRWSTASSTLLVSTEHANSRGTKRRERRNIRYMTVGDEEIRLTRGERKRLLRLTTAQIIREQQAHPDLLPSKFLSAHGRRARALREEAAAAAVAVTEPMAKKPRVRKTAPVAAAA